MYFALSIDVGAGNSMKKLAAGAPALTQLTWQGVELEAWTIQVQSQTTCIEFWFYHAGFIILDKLLNAPCLSFPTCKKATPLASPLYGQGKA